VIDEKYVSLTCIMGGKGRTDISDNSDDAIMKIVSQELKRLFGLQVPPIEYVVHPYKYALPIYSNDLADCWVTLGQQLSDEKHSLSFLGNYTGEISIRGMNSVAARVGREVVK
jgi:protoporphyrinogen oxidase